MALARVVSFEGVDSQRIAQMKSEIDVTALAVFLFFRSDPETWPLGDIGFLESFRDVEVLQHRFFVLLIVAFSYFEWRVRATNWQA